MNGWLGGWGEPASWVVRYIPLGDGRMETGARFGVIMMTVSFEVCVFLHSSVMFSLSLHVELL